MVETLENQIKDIDVLDIRYLEQLSEWDMQLISRRGIPCDTFIVLRTLNGDTKTTLHVKSEDIGAHALSIFNEKIKISERITPKNFDRFKVKIFKDLIKLETEYKRKRPR